MTNEVKLFNNEMFGEVRVVMKEIKLPTKMKNTQSAECHCYNAAIEECKEAIKQADHEVEE